jgi:mannose-6-phosphate isomerase-like protein (cupin superfamily)
MELKSTLRVFNQEEVSAGPGVVKGQTLKRLAGNAQYPTEKVMVGLASFKPGTLEQLHWHLIEVFYYVISGRAVMRDIEGRTYNIGPGSVIYAPAGIAGSHEWEIKDELQLLSVRATTDPEKNIQFEVDKITKQSSIGFEYLMSRGGAKFKSLY